MQKADIKKVMVSPGSKVHKDKRANVPKDKMIRNVINKGK